MSYPIGGNNIEAQAARTRLLIQQNQAQIRASELTVATEVTNAALQVTNAAEALAASQKARELSQRRLDAEMSRFEVGMSNNYQVVQSQRDLREAQNSELRALLNYQKSLVEFDRVQQAGAPLGKVPDFLLCVNTASSSSCSPSSAELRRITSPTIATRAPRLRARGPRVRACNVRAAAAVWEAAASAAAEGGFGRGPRPPLTVELAPVTRRDMIDTVAVVGNLVGAATVDAVPRGQGRLDAVYVKLGDPVRRGQAIAKTRRSRDRRADQSGRSDL